MHLYKIRIISFAVFSSQAMTKAVSYPEVSYAVIVQLLCIFDKITQKGSSNCVLCVHILPIFLKSCVHTHHSVGILWLTFVCRCNSSRCMYLVRKNGLYSNHPRRVSFTCMYFPTGASSPVDKEIIYGMKPQINNDLYII